MLKIGLLFFVIFLFGSVLAQPEVGDVIPGGEKIINTTEKTREFIEDEKWIFLGEQWKEILLNIEAIASLHEFFLDTNIIFRILLGIDYDLSFLLFIAIFLWVFFFVMAGRALSVYAPFSKSVAWIISAAFTILLAQLQIIKGLGTFLLGVIFERQGFWRWVAFIAIIIVLLLIFAVIGILIKSGADNLRKKRELKQKLDQKVLGQTVKSILEEP